MSRRAKDIPIDTRIRMHERMQQASALIRSAADELPADDPHKAKVAELSNAVWELGYVLLEESDGSHSPQPARVG